MGFVSRLQYGQFTKLVEIFEKRFVGLLTTDKPNSLLQFLILETKIASTFRPSERMNIDGLVQYTAARQRVVEGKDRFNFSAFSTAIV